MSGGGAPDQPPRIGISACLLGCAVRYDGAHKRDDALVDALGTRVQWLPVCPEVELGMGTPREPICLLREGDTVRLVAPGSGRDWTVEMRAYCARRVGELAAAGLCGFVLKQDSPSCGLEGVMLHGPGAPAKAGRGIFAEALCALLPELPVEEEGRLRDPRQRERFVERVLQYQRRAAMPGDAPPTAA